MNNRKCHKCGKITEIGYYELCQACVEQNAGGHVKNGHTECCAKRLASGYECDCAVENFELRDPMELLKTISRLGRERR